MRARTIQAGLGLLLVFAAAVPVTAHGPDPILGGGLWAQNKVLEYRWHPAGTPPTDIRAAVNAARDDANATRRSKTASFAYAIDATNNIYYGADVPCGINGLACLRRDPPGWFGVWLRPNGWRFDWGTLRWCQVAGFADGCYDAENIVLDELGHVLVLDHHDNFGDDSDFDDAVVQTYSRTRPRAGWNAHEFGRCDVATLQQQYDVANQSTPYSTCLDVPTRLGLAASRTSVVAGSMVTFTATLTSDGTGVLDGNAVTGRTVTLQVRTATGWADVLTLPRGADPGTYTGSLTVRATGDYRAAFRKPSSEGLRGSTSAAVTISVAPSCSGTCPQSGPGTAP